LFSLVVCFVLPCCGPSVGRVTVRPNKTPSQNVCAEYDRFQLYLANKHADVAKDARESVQYAAKMLDDPRDFCQYLVIWQLTVYPVGCPPQSVQDPNPVVEAEPLREGFFRTEQRAGSGYSSLILAGPDDELRDRCSFKSSCETEMHKPLQDVLKDSIEKRVKFEVRGWTVAHYVVSLYESLARALFLRRDIGQIQDDFGEFVIATALRHREIAVGVVKDLQYRTLVSQLGTSLAHVAVVTDEAAALEALNAPDVYEMRREGDGTTVAHWAVANHEKAAKKVLGKPSIYLLEDKHGSKVLEHAVVSHEEVAWSVLTNDVLAGVELRPGMTAGAMSLVGHRALRLKVVKDARTAGKEYKKGTSMAHQAVSMSEEAALWVLEDDKTGCLRSQDGVTVAENAVMSHCKAAARALKLGEKHFICGNERASEVIRKAEEKWARCKPSGPAK